MTSDSDDILRGRPDWSDERVATLLLRFFQRELPSALREHGETDSPLFVAASWAAPSSRKRTGRWLLPLCACGLIASVWTLRQSPSHDVLSTTWHGPAATVEFESTSWPVTSEQVTIAGLHGAFEQRSELRWTSQSFYEPEAGVWVEWTAPELVIDVESVNKGNFP